ncbi:MAG TPA: hypothetical protein VMI30_12045 [Stellaceae bacterium]|nr:hypothetical protein [Stellaceae bacterium]
MTEAEIRASAWLQAWDAQGTHRTGTAGDAAGGEWLAAEATALGAAVTVEDFTFDRLDPIACHLDIAGRRIEGVPVFDAPPTDAAGVTGTLGRDIAVAELSPRAVYTGAFQRLRRAGDRKALVVVCQGDAPGLGLINAEDFRQRYGTPAIHVSSEARDVVLAASRVGVSAQLVAHSQQTRARAVNIVITLAGTNTGKPPLVVMTPRSSWWQSTAERGGGLVCWLESLRALIAEPPRRDVVFTANTGHELGHLGLDEFLARRPGWGQPGAAEWIHYGANLGAFGGWLSLVSNADDLRRLGLAALTDAAQPPDDIPPPTLVPSGETRDIHKAGGRYLTLVGTNPLFHLPQDRWPHAVDVLAVARIGAAAAEMVRALSR